MVFLNTIFTLILICVLFLLLIFSLLMLKLFAGKSVNDPNYAPVKGTVFDQLFYFNTLHDYLTKIAEKHPTFRLLAPDQSELYTVDPKNIEHVLKTKFDKYSKGIYNQEIITDLFGQGIFAVDGEKWRQQRKLSSFEFSTRVLRDFSCSVFRRNASMLLGIVSGFSASGRDFDMQDLLMRCTLDSIFKVGFGVELNCLDGSSREGTQFMKSFDESNGLIYWRFVDPTWKLKRFFNVCCEASLKKHIHVIHKFVNQLIKTKREMLEERRQDCNEKEDILSRFLMESVKDPENMTDEYLRDIILNFMIAGKDTSANTLSWFFYMLCKNPVVQEKVAQEIRDVFGSEISQVKVDEFVANITDSALDNMHFLHATLTETLRLYPAVPIDGRSAEIDDILPDGFRVRQGDGVFYMAYSMGRMTNIWGDNAADFVPERWLQNGIFTPQSPFKFVAFHAGPRICLGKDFAYRQMKILAIALLFFFRFRLSDESKNITYRTMFTLHIDGELPLCAAPRTEALTL